MNHEQAFEWVFHRRRIEDSLLEWRTVRKIIYSMPLPIERTSLYALLPPGQGHVLRRVGWSAKMQVMAAMEIALQPV